MADQANLTLARLAACVLLCLACHVIDGDVHDNHVHGLLAALHDTGTGGTNQWHHHVMQRMGWVRRGLDSRH